MDIMKTIQRMFAKQAKKMSNIVGRGVLTMVDDEKKMQSVQFTGLADEAFEGAERMQNYGFSSNPLPGAECIIVCVGAARNHPVIVVADDRGCRAGGCEPGEVKVYTHEGDFIHLKNGNEIHLQTKRLFLDVEEDAILWGKSVQIIGDESVHIETPNLALGGKGGEQGQAQMAADIKQDGSIESSGDHKAAGVSLINHPHSDSGGSGNSGPPIAGG